MATYLAVALALLIIIGFWLTIGFALHSAFA
jgi:hypothetical protein